MKISDLADTYENYGDVVKITDFEHFFNVYQDDQKYFKYNLNSTVYFDSKNAKMLEYVVKYDSHWTLISYNIYKTTRLAWLLMKLNDVKPTQVFDLIRAGTTVKYLSTEQVQKIIEAIQ